MEEEDDWSKDEMGIEVASAAPEIPTAESRASSRLKSYNSLHN